MEASAPGHMTSRTSPLTMIWTYISHDDDPLFRFFEREVKMGAKLLQDVWTDLLDVVQVCKGKKKQTNYLRTLINELVKGILTRSWSRFTVPAGMTVIQWVADFSDRIEQLQVLKTWRLIHIIFTCRTFTCGLEACLLYEKRRRFRTHRTSLVIFFG
uniref:Dynein heavy chain C-terminal domain-containing protein n=1 Tax=Leptobrachium leishanense TaxID=445787 RepID=A0A8C5R1X9_9ANUR